MSWRRGQSYSVHLRDRVLAAVDSGMGAYAAAAVFRVSVSWIYKACARRRSTGETTARAQRNHVLPKLAAQGEAIRSKVKLDLNSGAEKSMADQWIVRARPAVSTTREVLGD